LTCHVRGLAIEADGHDRLGARAYCRFNEAWVQVAAVRLDIDEDGIRTSENDDLGRRGEGEGRYDHLVARSDAEGHEADQQGVRAACDRYTVAYARIARESILHFDNFGAQNVLAVREDGRNSAVELILDCSLLARKVHEGDHWRFSRHRSPLSM